MDIKVENLTFGYVKQPLLFSGMSFEIKKGQRALLLGCEDSGKTTLLKLLCGLEDLFFGKILIDKKDIKVNRDVMRNISLLLNPPVLFENKTVEENLFYQHAVLEEILKGKSLSKNEQNKLKIAKTSEIESKMLNFLPKISKKCKIKKLNMQEKLQVSIVRSMIKNPRIVMLDDVDKLENCEIFNCLVEEKTVICSASKLPSVEVLFDKILFLSLSRIYEYSSLEKMKEEKVNLQAVNMFEDLKKTKAILELNEDGYFLKLEDKKCKMGDMYFEHLQKLKMELFDEEAIVLVTESDEADHLFNLLDKGKVWAYEELTGEKIF